MVSVTSSVDDSSTWIATEKSSIVIDLARQGEADRQATAAASQRPRRPLAQRVRNFGMTIVMLTRL
jgi:hypothetical protein